MRSLCPGEGLPGSMEENTLPGRVRKQAREGPRWPSQAGSMSGSPSLFPPLSTFFERPWDQVCPSQSLAHPLTPGLTRGPQDAAD